MQVEDNPGNVSDEKESDDPNDRPSLTGLRRSIVVTPSDYKVRHTFEGIMILWCCSTSTGLRHPDKLSLNYIWRSILGCQNRSRVSLIKILGAYLGA